MQQKEVPLSDIEPIALRPHDEGRKRGSRIHKTHSAVPAPSPAGIYFDRCELSQILGLYGRKVSSGEWRDYAIDGLRDKAVFSIFRRASEFPLYRIEKNPKLARKQGAYSVITPSGLILKRGHNLKNVLNVLERKLKLVDA